MFKIVGENFGDREEVYNNACMKAQSLFKIVDAYYMCTMGKRRMSLVVEVVPILSMLVMQL